jgi:hypothetical protein
MPEISSVEICMRRHATSLDPVQAPDKCELIITLKRARGLNIPLYSVKECVNGVTETRNFLPALAKSQERP